MTAARRISVCSFFGLGLGIKYVVRFDLWSNFGSIFAFFCQTILKIGILRIVMSVSTRVFSTGKFDFSLTLRKIFICRLTFLKRRDIMVV